MMSRLHKSLKVLSFFMTSLVLGLPALSAEEVEGETIDVVLFEEAVQGPVFVISLPEDAYSDSEWKAKRDLFVKHLSVELSLILQGFSLASTASEVEAVALPVEMRRQHLDSKGKTADVIRIVLPLVSASAEEYQDAVYDMWHLLEKVVNTFIAGLPDMDYAKIKADLDKQEAETESSEESGDLEEASDKSSAAESDEAEVEVQGVPVEMTSSSEEEAAEKETEEVTSVSDGEAGESSQTEGTEKTEEGEAETESSEESGDLEEASDETSEAESEGAEVEAQDVTSSSEEESGAEEETKVIQGVPVEMSDTAEETEEKTAGVSEEQDGDQEEESGCSRGTSEMSKEQMEESEESSSGGEAHEVLEVEKSNYGAGGI